MRTLLRASLALVVVVPASMLIAADPPAVARVSKPEEARRRLGLLPNYATVGGIKQVKVAVLDSGFAGVDGKRPYLPPDTVVIEHYAPDFVRKFGLGDPKFTKPFRPGDAHGRLLAQVVWAATGNSPDGPKFYLLNANGPTMFRRAVRAAIESKVDIILFGGTFEGAGNYDGRGPINAAVDEAVAAGIIWVNAAGNTGGAVFNGPVDVGLIGFVLFGSSGQTALRLRSRVDENEVTLTLTWNDYRDTEDAGTEKDLDLVVEDARGVVVGESKLKQVGPGRVTGEGETKNPRERLILTDLAATAPCKEYRIRVKANTANFGPRDRLRILLAPGRPPVTNAATRRAEPSAELLDATRGGEVYPPADHAGVLTVGDLSSLSAVGPTADGRVKPDVIVSESVVRFTNGEETAGASNAAAYFAGIVAVMRATEPQLTAGHIREWVRTLDRVAAAPVPAGVGIVGQAAPVPPAPVMPLTPNQLRALRFSEYALDEKRRRGDPDPTVIVSSPSGEWVVRPGGRVVGLPPAVMPSAPAVAPIPTGRVAPSHAPWRTPTPRQLADLVRGR
ncbi:MAG: S8 family serine peptidase [Planctomycetia bacterium]|nr:S8 family serine peptidase [Planctomycetia bacterium]